jgi:hypothetical protein
MILKKEIEKIAEQKKVAKTTMPFFLFRNADKVWFLKVVPV